ncbi:cobW-domain-containing protein [Pilatotrama ljubarskyi]|nr:cobW-domain-containing protein [Pilatotrama ljubarskyi]
MADEENDIPELLDTAAQYESVQQRTVPLTIICGFLGAGKSTLVRRILTERHGYRIAVIMNEFGDTADIEAKTINVTSPDDPSQQSEEFLELANGCLCCSIKDSGIAAIEKLMQRKGAFDHILLETTGLADPGPIASLFWQNEEFSAGLGREIHLDGVVCVVDAVFGRQQMEDDHAADGIGESLRQIAAADVILLNKVDLVTPAEADATEEIIRGVNPAASVYRTIRGEIDLKHLMGIDAYASRQLLSETRTAAVTQCRDDHDHAHGHDHEHEHEKAPTHYELRGISSLQIDCPKLTTAQLERLDEWIRTVLWERQLPNRPSAEAGSIEVLRCKGIFVTTDGQLHVLQGVRNLYEIAEVEKGEQELGLPDTGKLVLIGKGLQEDVRHSLLEQLDIA